MPNVIKRLEPGQKVGYSVIVKLCRDSQSYETRLYECRTECCGRLVHLTQRQLKDAERRERAGCIKCRGKQNARPPAPRQTVKIGDVMGPVTVLAAGPTSVLKRVLWSCCGREDLIGHERLYRMRHNAKTQPEAVCMSCYVARRQGQSVTVAQPRTDWRPTEILPPGIISAAEAWPRPRMGA